jgi:hypothetical protein
MSTPESFDAEQVRTEAPAWLVDLSIVLGAAVIILGVWLIKEVRSDPEHLGADAPPAAAAPRASISGPVATDIVDRRLVSLYLEGATRSIRADDAVWIDRTTGEMLIGSAFARSTGDFLNDPVRTTPGEVATGDVAVYGVSWGLGDPTDRRGAGIVIVTFEDGKIAREVVFEMGGVRATDDMLK